MSAPIATVMIVTKDRCDDLRLAVSSALRQKGRVEVLVIDDGSRDRTSAMIASEFPDAKLVTHDESRGLVVRRNEGVAAAGGNIVISIDDDAVFTTPDIVEETVAAFDDERIGAVAIPFANVKRGPHLLQLAPDAAGTYVSDTFIGTAHAIRRDLFLRLGGYRGGLFHQGEEADYCIRLLAAGYVVRLGAGHPIHHFESPRRDFRRMDHYGPRNAILFAWQNIPLPFAMLQVPMTIGGVMIHTFNPGRVVTRLGGLVDGVSSCATFERAPVSSSVYQLWRRMRKAPAPLRLNDIATELATQ